MTNCPPPDTSKLPDTTGYTATFHLPGGLRLVVTVARAHALAWGSSDEPTRLELQDSERRVIARGNLAAMLRRAGIE